MIVAHELERRRHVLVRERPVPMQVVEIVAAILQEHAERLGGFSLPDQRRVNVSAANVGEAANMTDDLAERIGSLPRDGECRDPARTVPADNATGRIRGKVESLRRLGKKFLEKKPGVRIAQ